ncbi:hypothetical protein F5Y02DRAFT_394857 [Annulohypoxylon stygium]|nr:hypothetical protein F5Y02DRAFT_394857 [Annulohypoxylon stygium]
MNKAELSSIRLIAFGHQSRLIRDFPLKSDWKRFQNKPLVRRLPYLSEGLPQPPIELQDHSNVPPTAYGIYERTYTCFYLSVAAIGLLVASFGISLWWSISYGDVSGGFGIGSYMIAASGGIIAISTYVHRQNCRCWVRGSVSQISTAE